MQGETVLYKRIVHATQWSEAKKKTVDYYKETAAKVTFDKYCAWQSCQILVRTPCGTEKRTVKLSSVHKILATV